ncbi:MAG: hypothetical protein KAQ62_16805, partial [Cyclobacteriaceae bacterium]|nr:hypothetical protein [Cyclobacteriaceae bacterium]
MKAPEKPYNEESPLYHIRNIRAFMEYTHKHYPEVDHDEILEYAGISRQQFNDWGFWFNQRQANRFMEILEEKTGNNNIAREAGQYNITEQNIIAQYLLGFKNISSLIVGVNKLYSKISIGAKAWGKRLAKYKVEMSAKPEPGVIEQPYQCLNRLGAIEGIIFFFVRQIPRIEHPECVHRGDEICRYIIS